MDTRIEAVVQAGGSETPYVSHGRGQPAVLVAATDGDRARLAALLVGEHRLIEPVPPALTADSPEQGERLGTWLLGLIEGLGLQAPRVLLAPAFAAHAGAVAAFLAGADATVSAGDWEDP